MAAATTEAPAALATVEPAMPAEPAMPGEQVAGQFSASEPASLPVRSLRTAHDVGGPRTRTGDVLLAEPADFESLLLSRPVLEGLRAAGFERPSPVQLKAIPLGRCGLGEGGGPGGREGGRGAAAAGPAARAGDAPRSRASVSASVKRRLSPEFEGD